MTPDNPEIGVYKQRVEYCAKKRRWVFYAYVLKPDGETLRIWHKSSIDHITGDLLAYCEQAAHKALAPYIKEAA